MAVWLALMVALIPAAISPGLLFYFDVTPKAALLLLGAAAALIWWVLAGAARAPRRFTWVNLWMALSLVVSTLVSVNPALSLGGSNWRRWGLAPQLAVMAVAYLVAAHGAGRADRLRMILRAIAASGLLTALYGAAQYFGWDPLLPAQSYHVGEGIWTIVRPPSTLDHADYFGNWLLCAVFSSAALLASEPRRWWRGVAWCAIAIGCVSVVLSGTRSAMVGLVAGGIVLAVWQRLRVTRRWLVAAGLLVAAAVVFYLSPAGAQLRARTHWSLEDRTGGARLPLWRESLRMAAARWPAGYGPETFTATFALRRSERLGRAYPDFFQESPHNMFLDVLVAQGLPGLALLAAFCLLGFAAAWRVRRNPLAGALAASLAAMTISQQFGVFIIPTALAFYVTVAMLVALSSPATEPAARRRPSMAMALLAAAWFAFCGVRLLVADGALAMAARDLDGGRLDGAERAFARFETWRPPGAGTDLWYARRLVQYAQEQPDSGVRTQALQVAGLAARRATQTAEEPFNAWYNLAAFYASQDDFARTEQSLRAAMACAPTWFKPHWMLAQVLVRGARLPEAETEAARAVALDGGMYIEVTRTLQQIRAQRSAMAQAPHE